MMTASIITKNIGMRSFEARSIPFSMPQPTVIAVRERKEKSQAMLIQPVETISLKSLLNVCAFSVTTPVVRDWAR